MKINAVVVDDEKNSREVLISLLEKFCPEVNIVGEASDVEPAFDLISASKPDLVFLDIQMPMGNGFDLLQKFNPIPFSVIFITGYDNYAMHAIKFSAIDYILKPIETEELKQAVNKAFSKKDDSNHYIVNFLNNIDEKAQDKKIPIHLHGNVKFINISSITHVEAAGVYSTVYCEGEKIPSAKSLKDFEDFLAEDSGFMRINKSVLINIRHIKGYSKGDPFIITLHPDITFEVSRRRKPEVIERLKDAIIPSSFFGKTK